MTTIMTYEQDIQNAFYVLCFIPVRKNNSSLRIEQSKTFPKNNLKKKEAKTR